MSTWLLAKTWAYEFAACSAGAVFPACSLAAGSVQRVFKWISRAVFSVMNAGHSLLVAGCAPSQFGHLGDSLFGQSSYLWVPKHNEQTSSVAKKGVLWQGWGIKSQEKGSCLYLLPSLVVVTLLASFTWGWSWLRLDMLRSPARSSFGRSWAAYWNLTTPLV